MPCRPLSLPRCRFSLPCCPFLCHAPRFLCHADGFLSQIQRQISRDRLAGSSAGSSAGSIVEGENDYDELSIVKDKYTNKATHEVIDFLYHIMSCNSDEPILQVIKANKGDLKNIAWSEADGFSAMREIYRLLNMHKAVVNTGTSNPPEVGRKTLQRYNSESQEDPEQQAEQQRERDQAWKQAVAVRKKTVFIGSANIRKIEDIRTFFQKTPAYKAWNGRPGEAHRVFLFSSDLFQESPTQPWKSEPDITDAAALLEFITHQADTSDVLMLCDGRSKKCRKILDKALEHARSRRGKTQFLAPSRGAHPSPHRGGIDIKFKVFLFLLYCLKYLSYCLSLLAAAFMRIGPVLSFSKVLDLL